MSRTTRTVAVALAVVVVVVALGVLEAVTHSGVAMWAALAVLAAAWVSVMALLIRRYGQFGGPGGGGGGTGC